MTQKYRHVMKRGGNPFAPRGNIISVSKYTHQVADRMYHSLAFIHTFLTMLTNNKVLENKTMAKRNKVAFG